MAKFKDIHTTDKVEKEFVNKVFIYLESQTDYRILSERLFHDRLPYLEFIPVDTIQNSGGCTAVCTSVEEDRRQGLCSLGIVDRDALLRELKWDALWEIDDAKFKSKKPFGDGLNVLCRWEIENYLFDPEQLKQLVTDRKPDIMASTDTEYSFTSDLLLQCQSLIPVMAGNVILHKNAKKQLPLGYRLMETCTKSHILGEFDKYLCDSHNSEQADQEYEEISHRIAQFQAPDDADEREKLISLLRIIDGKRILFRLKQKFKLKDEIIYSLARRIKENDLIPEELTDLIQSITPDTPAV